MAITVEARTSIIELVVGMFGAAPGASVLSDLVAAYEKGQTIKQIAANLANTDQFKSIFPTFLTNAEYATKVVNQLVGTEVVQAEKDAAVTELTAILNGGASRSSVFVDAINAVNAITSTNAAWANAGAAFDNKVSVAVYYSVDKQLSASTLAGLQNVISGVTSVASTVTTGKATADGTASAGQSFAFTTGVDTFTGGAGNDTFTAGDVAGAAVWTTGDTLDGGAGADTFTVVANAAITTPTAATVKNIETASLTSGATVNVTAAGWTGLTALNVNSVGSGTQSITAAATTAIVAASSAMANAETITGGSTVSVTNTGVTAGGTLTIGGAGTSAAAGAVTVKSTSSTVDTTVQGTISVTGGTTVTIDQIAGNAVNTTTTAGAVTVTGNASTTDVTVTSSTARTASATAVGRVNGAVTITDGNATTASDTIKTVTLSNYGASTVASNVLSTVNLVGAATASGTLALNTTAADTSTRATTLNLNLGGGSVGAITGTQADLYTTVNIASSVASTIADQSFAAATALNFSGAAITTLTANTGMAAVTAITSTGAGVSLGTALATGVTFTGGDGAETISIGSTTKAITMGAGNDTVTTSSAAVGAGGSVAGGDGTDTIVMTFALADGADGTSTFNSKFSGFEVLKLSDAITGAIDVEGLNSVSKVILAAGSNGGTLNNLVSGGTVQMDADNAGALAVNVRSALVGGSDVANLALNKSGGVLAANTITIANVETINISAPDAATAGSAAAVNTMTLTAAAATKVTVTGNNGLNLTATGSTAVTTFDASGVVANGTADTAALLAVTYTSLNATGTANVSIIGGAGNDTLTGAAAIDTITGGAGADILKGAGGADTIVVGNGRDAVLVDSFKTVSIDSGTGTTDSVTGFVLGAAFGVATDISTVANFQAATVGGANATVLGIDMDTDGANTNQAITVEANATAQNGQAAGVTYTVTNGILTLGGTGASAVDTLGEWLTEAAAVAATDGEILAFQFGSDTYVYGQNGAQDVFIKLTGVTGAAALAEGAAASTGAANTIWYVDIA